MNIRSIADRYQNHMDKIEEERGFGKAMVRCVIHALVVVLLVGSVIALLPTLLSLTIVVVAAVLGVAYIIWWAYS